MLSIELKRALDHSIPQITAEDGTSVVTYVGTYTNAKFGTGFGKPIRDIFVSQQPRRKIFDDLLKQGLSETEATAAINAATSQELHTLAFSILTPRQKASYEQRTGEIRADRNSDSSFLNINTNLNYFNSDVGSMNAKLIGEIALVVLSGTIAGEALAGMATTVPTAETISTYSAESIASNTFASGAAEAGSTLFSLPTLSTITLPLVGETLNNAVDNELKNQVNNLVNPQRTTASNENNSGTSSPIISGINSDSPIKYILIVAVPVLVAVILIFKVFKGSK